MNQVVSYLVLFVYARKMQRNSDNTAYAVRGTSKFIDYSFEETENNQYLTLDNGYTDIRLHHMLNQKLVTSRENELISWFDGNTIRSNNIMVSDDAVDLIYEFIETAKAIVGEVTNADIQEMYAHHQKLADEWHRRNGCCVQLQMA